MRQRIEPARESSRGHTKMLEQFLSETEDHIDAARRRIKRQKIICLQMTAEDCKGAASQDLLRHFERCLLSLEASRDKINELLGST
jgi:hypothetical protein